MRFIKQLRAMFYMICSVIYLLLGIAPIQAYAGGPSDYFGEYTWPNIPGTNTDKALDQWHITVRSDSEGEPVRKNEQVNSTGNWGKWIWSKCSVTTEGNKTTIIKAINGMISAMQTPELNPDWLFPYRTVPKERQ